MLGFQKMASLTQSQSVKPTTHGLCWLKWVQLQCHYIFPSIIRWHKTLAFGYEMKSF